MSLCIACGGQSYEQTPDGTTLCAHHVSNDFDAASNRAMYNFFHRACRLRRLSKRDRDDVLHDAETPEEVYRTWADA